LLGAHCANTSSQVLDSLSGFANRAGLLFQVIDDILDAEADTATLGKTAGKDRADKKPTFYSLLGAHEAKQFALRLREEAQQALLPLGANAMRLQQITDYIAARHF
jgi:farnesyl diphosphate synthase